MRAGQRRPPPSKPVAALTVEIRRPGLAGRLQLLGLPKEIIDLILETKYRIDNRDLPLFGLQINKNGEWDYRNQEVIDVVNIYESMRDRLVGPNKEKRSDTEVLAEFDQYIKSLAENRTKKSLAGVTVTDDTIFESPQLLEMREQEALKDTLLNRKRVPIKFGPDGRCGKCKSEEGFQTEKYLRSGDEGAVFINECAKCGHKWNA